MWDMLNEMKLMDELTVNVRRDEQKKGKMWSLDSKRLNIEGKLNLYQFFFLIIGMSYKRIHT